MKRIIAFVLAFAMCVSLCACGGSGAPASSQSQEKTITVHAQIPADWANPGCWAWSMPDAKDAFEQWPGVGMTRNDDWYAVEAPAWINYVIINGNGGSVQTADLPVDAGKDIWVVVDQTGNAKVFYEEPGEKSLNAENPQVSADYHETMSAVLDKDAYSPITANKAVTYRMEAGYMEEPEPYSGTYTTEYIPGALIAQSSEEAMYIVRCIYREKYVGSYEFGGNGYRVILDFEILQRSSIRYVNYYAPPVLVATASFEGSDPPEVIEDTNDHCGDLPDANQIKQWISQVIQSANEQRKADALAHAKNTVTAGPFSYSGLIESLTDVEIHGCTYEEAVYAADNCGADWFEEAAESAVRYIGWGIEEKDMLVQMLEEDGFTHEQAVYGAETSGL